MTDFDEAYWQSRYRDHGDRHRQDPHSPQLEAEVDGLPVGTALDAGCGTGANSIWLASHGWQVTGIDIAANAIEAARRRAADAGPDVSARIDWVVADLMTWSPDEDTFDLVTSHYAHPSGPFSEFVARLASLVAPGGTLLVVTHGPHDTHSAEHAPAPASQTADDLAACLPSGEWEVEVAETRNRDVAGPNGHRLLLEDVVLRARRLG